MTDEHTLLLGEIKGQIALVIDGQKTTNERLDSVDGRLRHVERKAALNGAISGGIVSVGMAIAIEKLKAITGIGG